MRVHSVVCLIDISPVLDLRVHSVVCLIDISPVPICTSKSNLLGLYDREYLLVFRKMCLTVRLSLRPAFDLHIHMYESVMQSNGNSSSLYRNSDTTILRTHTLLHNICYMLSILGSGLLSGVCVCRSCFFLFRACSRQQVKE